MPEAELRLNPLESLCDPLEMDRYLIVGAGFSGAVLARELAEVGLPSLVIDSRSHIGGNCHTERDAGTGVMVHEYGPHIFNTDNERVWEYVNRFGRFHRYVNRVKASIPQGVFSLPINLHTINQFYQKRFTPTEARAFIESIADKTIAEPRNFEEQALRFIGRDLYEAFFRGYTKKQWGVEPRDLPASILKRLPVRFNYNDAYYDKRHMGMPEDGYTAIIQGILNHERIEVKLQTPYESSMREEFNHVFFTGPIDQFFDFAEGRLGYRTVYWKRETLEGDQMGNAVINYPHLSEPFTRILEHKHFAYWESHDNTVICTEYSKRTTPEDVPYYPMRLPEDKAMLNRYGERLEDATGVSFLGRLATYRYLDMDKVIHEALEFAGAFLTARRQGDPLPKLSAPLSN